MIFTIHKVASDFRPTPWDPAFEIWATIKKSSKYYNQGVDPRKWYFTILVFAGVRHSFFVDFGLN